MSGDDLITAASFQLCRWSWERKPGVTRKDVEDWLRAARDGTLSEQIADSERRWKEHLEPTAPG